MSQAARTFGIAISTAHGIVRRYRATGQIDYNKRGGCVHKKLTNGVLQALLDWVENSADITLKTIVARIMSTFGVAVSEKTVSLALTKSGFTMKLLRIIPESRNTPETICARREYALRFMNEAPMDRRHIIWIDETGFNLHLRRKYGRALAGLRANVVVANSRGHNISICAAMSEEGMLSHMVHRGAYTALLFCTFLERLFAHLLALNRPNCWLILDNVRFHHCEIVAECAARNGHQLIFLPAYSPMLNPIEYLFGKWKASVKTRHVAFTQEALMTNIEVARLEISVTDCLGWIRDVNRNIASSLLNHAFID